jgi:hypothetical protein
MTNVPVERISLHLEPVARDATLVEGLQARVGDPLWLLTRQWQFMELAGEDNGTPAWVRLQADISQLTRYLPTLPDTTPGSPADLDKTPLERRIENEWQPRSEPAPRLAASAGAQYLRLLAAAPDPSTLTGYRNGLLSYYRLRPTGIAAEDPYLQVVAGRTIDGTALYQDLLAALRPASGPPGLPPDPPLAGADEPTVRAAALRYLSWYDATTGRDLPDTPAWLPDRLEYQLAVAAPLRSGELVLAADEYDSGTLDWSSFDVVPDASLDATLGDLPNRQIQRLVQTRLPSPVTYRGMPNERWWEFEDAEVDFGRVEAPGEEVVTLLAVEFAMRYGNDFFYFPLRLDVGAVCRVTSLVVGDTFGTEWLIDPVTTVDTADGAFRLFEPSVSSSTDRCDALILFPTATGVLSGAPIEQLALVRDEMANVCWAVETVAVDTTGVIGNRNENYPQSRGEQADAAPSGDPLTYQLRTSIPDNWYPLFPGYGVARTRLRLGTLAPLPGAPDQPPPWGRIAGGLEAVDIPGEEVTRTGAVLTRSYQYARWTDGTQHLWVGRRRSPGRGNVTSGLRFDNATRGTVTS